MPMRFADVDGTTIDVYQAATQMTDESAQTYPFTADTLFDRALGPLGYYGVFTANMHTDLPTEQQSDAAVSSAIAHGILVVSAKQMLDWLDGRNGSSFGSIASDWRVRRRSRLPRRARLRMASRRWFPPQPAARAHRHHPQRLGGYVYASGHQRRVVCVLRWRRRNLRRPRRRAQMKG